MAFEGSSLSEDLLISLDFCYPGTSPSGKRRDKNNQVKRFERVELV